LTLAALFVTTNDDFFVAQNAAFIVAINKAQRYFLPVADFFSN